MNLFDLSICVMTPRRCVEGDSPAVLAREARTLIAQLVESGLGVRQSDEAQRDWYAAPALRLARHVNRLRLVVEERRRECTEEWIDPCSLPHWAMAGWLLVVDAYLAATTPTSAAEDRKARDDDRVQAVLGRSGEWFGPLRAVDWEEAHRIAASGLLDARWDVVNRTVVVKRTRFLIQLLDAGGRRSLIRC